ncbi:MAG TPA: Uma2 family endonuclease, partial [Gemmatimonadaceae bacterium]
LRLSPSDVRLTPELVVQPDLFVIPSDNGRRPSAAAPVTHVLLSIEVLSPDSARFDRVLKRRAYQAAGVPEYWIVDPDAQTIERWRPADNRAEVLDKMLTWRPDDRLELTVDVGALFAEVTDD